MVASLEFGFLEFAVQRILAETSENKAAISSSLTECGQELPAAALHVALKRSPEARFLLAPSRGNTIPASSGFDYTDPDLAGPNTSKSPRNRGLASLMVT
jgi:hypothetical protein